VFTLQQVELPSKCVSDKGLTSRPTRNTTGHFGDGCLRSVANNETNSKTKVLLPTLL